MFTPKYAESRLDGPKNNPLRPRLTDMSNLALVSDRPLADFTD